MPELSNHLRAGGYQVQDLADGTDERDAVAIRQLEVEFPFAWGDASPATVREVATGKLVRAVRIHITTPFNGAGPALTVGDAGDPDRLMTASQNNPAEAAMYEASPGHRYGSDTNVLLTITPGAGASAGAGLLTLLLER